MLLESGLILTAVLQLSLSTAAREQENVTSVSKEFQETLFRHTMGQEVSFLYQKRHKLISE